MGGLGLALSACGNFGRSESPPLSSQIQGSPTHPHPQRAQSNTTYHMLLNTNLGTAGLVFSWRCFHLSLTWWRLSFCELRKQTHHALQACRSGTRGGGNTTSALSEPKRLAVKEMYLRSLFSEHEVSMPEIVCLEGRYCSGMGKCGTRPRSKAISEAIH